MIPRDLWLTGICWRIKFQILAKAIFWSFFNFCIYSNNVFNTPLFLYFLAFCPSCLLVTADLTPVDCLGGVVDIQQRQFQCTVCSFDMAFHPLRLCSTAELWLQDLPHCVIIAVSTPGSPRRDRINQDLLQSTRRVPPRWCCIKRRVAHC